MLMKKILLFIVFLLAFLIPAFIFKSDAGFYESLSLPQFAPPKEVFSIWILLYILIAYVFAYVFSTYDKEEINDFKQIAIVNYILNISFTPVFFEMQNYLLAMLITIATFITSVFLLYETYKLNKRLSILLIPYVLWTLLASILIIAVFIMN